MLPTHQIYSDIRKYELYSIKFSRNGACQSFGTVAAVRCRHFCFDRFFFASMASLGVCIIQYIYTYIEYNIYIFVYIYMCTFTYVYINIYLCGLFFSRFSRWVESNNISVALEVDSQVCDVTKLDLTETFDAVVEKGCILAAVSGGMDNDTDIFRSNLAYYVRWYSHRMLG